MKDLKITSKHLGILLIISAVMLSLLLYSFAIQYNNLIHQGGICPIKDCNMEHVPYQTFIGITIVVVLVIVALFLILKPGQLQEVKPKTKEEWKKIMKTLNEEERKIYEILVNAQGAIFQSELVEKTGFPKVRVSRILDRLEGKNLVERRRRGMSNIIVLKHE